MSRRVVAFFLGGGVGVTPRQKAQDVEKVGSCTGHALTAPFR
mgnify:CR=1 FL=1